MTSRYCETCETCETETKGESRSGSTNDFVAISQYIRATARAGKMSETPTQRLANLVSGAPNRKIADFIEARIFFGRKDGIASCCIEFFLCEWWPAYPEGIDSRDFTIFRLKYTARMERAGWSRDGVIPCRACLRKRAEER